MTTTHHAPNPTTADPADPAGPDTTPTPLAESGDTLLLTLDEAAHELRCARRSLERHIAAHRLAAVHLGRSVRIERGELERFIHRLREPGKHGVTHG